MLYRVGAITIYATPTDPRISLRLWVASDTVRVGRQEVWRDLVPLSPPREPEPTKWFLGALEQWLER